MTLIEFYDTTVAHTAMGPLALHPDKIVLVGEKYGMKEQGERLRALLESRGNPVEMEYLVIHRSEVRTVLETLSGILDREKDCQIDLTGGEDLALFAAGQIFERYRDRGLQFHWFNVRTGQVKDCDLDGEKAVVPQPTLSVEEQIALCGGRVIFDDEKPDTSHRWPEDEEFGRDIQAMWAVCANDCDLWNRQIQILNEIDRYRDKKRPALVTEVDVAKIWPILTAHHGDVDLNAVFADLAERGIFSEFTLDSQKLRLRYKNKAIQEALGKAGTALELMTWHLARTLEYKGSRVYDDADTGVYIDWDGVLQEKYAPETDNEIDVLLMKGMVPFFISCKNGTIDVEELYKVHTVAERFGGPYARKVLICTTWGSLNQRKQEVLKDRAREMGIYILEGVHRMDAAAFRNELRKLDDKTIHVR